jgi:hypothetical protein
MAYTGRCKSDFSADACFQAGESHAFVLTSGAGGLGVRLSVDVEVMPAYP